MYRFLFLLLIVFFATSCDSSGINIFSQGEYYYSITLDDPTDSLQVMAGKELAKYFKQVTGTDVPDEAEQSIRLKVEGEEGVGYYLEDENLVIYGADSELLLSSVYTFLENELDIRFLAPDAEKIPISTQISIPKDLNYSYSPPITTRTVHSRLFYQNHGFAAKRKVTTEAFPGYVPGARVHTFHRFMPASKYMDEHPEYYALRNGKRLSTQLCLTNENVFRIVRDTVEQMLAANPHSGVISVSQDDNTQYCQCDRCEAIHEAEGSPSGSMIYFVNKIALEFPDKTISTLAYQYTRKAPRTLIPEPNVLITLCSIECDRSAPIGEKCEDFAQDLIDWGAITDNVRIWDYTTQFTNFLAPFPNTHTLQPNIQLFRDNNAKWVFEQHSNNPSSLFHYRSYLTANLLWNPDIEVDSVRIDFVNAYYGEAGPTIEKYIVAQEQAILDDPDFFLFLYGDPSQGFDSWLSHEKIEEYNQLFDKASESVRGETTLEKRVNMARIEIDYASLEFFRTQMGNLSEGLRDQISNTLDRFKETTEVNNITMMNEMRFSVEEYLNFYDKALARAKGENLARSKPVTTLTQPKKYADEDPLVLTDGALGGASFYSNWLGYEGNDVEVVIDLEEINPINEISTAFLQVTNHVVFFPNEVQFLLSSDGENYRTVGKVQNQFSLTKTSKINDIQEFGLTDLNTEARYVKVVGVNMKKAPEWHHAAGLGAWIFVDEVQVR